jgi:hypothetical protein
MYNAIKVTSERPLSATANNSDRLRGIRFFIIISLNKLYLQFADARLRKH